MTFLSGISVSWSPGMEVICIPVLQSCSCGYHAGGWGKPPVDETGKPLYGDVFGTNAAEFQVWAVTSKLGLTLGHEVQR